MNVDSKMTAIATIQQLRNGKKLYNTSWERYEYIKLSDDEKHIIDEKGTVIDIVDVMQMLIRVSDDGNMWKIHEGTGIAEVLDHGHQKIRRIAWEVGRFIKALYDTENFVDQNGVPVLMNFNDIVATDWEPYNQ